MKKIKIVRLTAVLVVFTIIAALFAGCVKLSDIDKVAQTLNSYQIEAVFNDDSKELTATQKLLYTNNSQSDLADLRFHLYPNAYRDGAKYRAVGQSHRTRAYPNGASYGSITINYVKLDGQQTQFQICGEDSNILLVTLAEPLPHASTVDIEIGFSVKLANVLHRLGYSEQTVNLGNFYPIVCRYENGGFVEDAYYSIGDPFYSDTANYKVVLTYPSHYVPSLSGAVDSTTQSGQLTTVESSAKCVRDFAVVLTRQAQVLSQTVDGVKVNYSYYDDNQPQTSLSVAVDSLQFFSQSFGVYPYAELTVCQTNIAFNGMEYPSLVFIRAQLEPAEYYEVIVHEIAHQWWYGVVGNNQIKDAWLDEGLTEYSTMLFMEQSQLFEFDKNQRVDEYLKSYALFCNVNKKNFPNATTEMTREIYKYSSEMEYTYMTYIKGLLMFDTLAQAIGTKAMLNGLQRVYAKHAFNIATVQSFVYEMERGSRQKLEKFFSAWLDGKVVIGNE